MRTSSETVKLRMFRVKWATCLGSLFFLCGCEIDGAPSYSIAGAFFPAWLLCAALGVVGTLLFRVLLIVLTLDDVMPVKLLVYAAFGSGLATWLWLSVFGGA